MSTSAPSCVPSRVPSRVTSRVPSRLTSRLHDDRGSAMLLGVGLVAVCMLALVGCIDGAVALVQRQALLSTADAAAIAGAQGIDLDEYYARGATAATRLDPVQVVRLTRQHLAGSTAPEGMAIERIWSDGTDVRVRLSAPLRLPFLPFLSTLAADRITVESRAQLQYRAIA